MNANESPHRKTRVGIFFGGKSAEHEVSLQSAKNVLEALDKGLFEPVLIGIDKQGRWHAADAGSLNAGAVGLPEASAKERLSLTLLPGGQKELVGTGGEGSDGKSTIDVAFPVLHGPQGEDGSIQGFLELAGVPYVGPGVMSSSVGMDKDVMKRLLRDAGLPIAPFQVFHDYERSNIEAQRIIEMLGSPVFVKPANMGSSVGVSRAVNASELEAAIDTAFRYDTKILIESAVVGSEIECAVLGNTQPKASTIGRIIPKSAEFYSYDAKYIDADGATLEIPADISTELSARAQEIALQTFKVLGCEGMGRVDMFLTDAGEIIVNEINTIPGFTKISMYPKLWEASGKSYTELITDLIQLALERHDRRSALSTGR